MAFRSLIVAGLERAGRHWARAPRAWQRPAPSAAVLLSSGPGPAPWSGSNLWPPIPMTRNTTAKVQHYVPQFLLRHFGVGKKRHIHVFDKQTGKIFKSTSRNVAAESRYYDYEINGVSKTAEADLANLEERSSKIIKNLINTENIRSLTVDDRAILALFCAVQMTRTRAHREQSHSLREMLAAWLRASARDDGDRIAIEECIGPEPDENQATIEAVRMIYEDAAKFAPHFYAKVWILIKSDGRIPFCIGDNPVGMQSLTPGGKIGLNVPGIELHLPLTPKIVLAMYCPSLVEKLRNARDIMATIAAGRPLLCSRENVVNINSIQIAFSERYVFSNTGDFRLVREMMEDEPSLRSGPRFSRG
jgi:hypothetical protein